MTMSKAEEKQLEEAIDHAKQRGIDFRDATERAEAAEAALKATKEAAANTRNALAESVDQADRAGIAAQEATERADGLMRRLDGMENDGLTGGRPDRPRMLQLMDERAKVKGLRDSSGTNKNELNALSELFEQLTDSLAAEAKALAGVYEERMDSRRNNAAANKSRRKR